jgi:hypothetical protein
VFEEFCFKSFCRSLGNKTDSCINFLVPGVSPEQCDTVPIPVRTRNIPEEGLLSRAIRLHCCAQFCAYGPEEVTKDKFEGIFARLGQRDGGAGKLEGKADKEADPCWRLLPRRIGDIKDSQRKPFRVFISGRRQDPIAASPTQRIG